MKRKYVICCILLMLMLAVSGCTKKSYLSSADDINSTASNSTANSTKSLGNSTKSSDKNATKTSDMCFVQVTGAVNSPGVYELGSDARVLHAILNAGGLREDADDASLNLAGKIADGMKIVVLTKDEAVAQSLSSNSDGKVNINEADEATLMTLPGIGQSKAKSIIKYREGNGPFASTEDIKNISGIKDGVYNKIADMIKV